MLLFGGLFGLVFYVWCSWWMGDVVWVVCGFKWVCLIGWLLLGFSLLVLLVSGWWLVYLVGWLLG